MKSIFLNLLAFSTLLVSVFSITSKNPVISVIYLIATFVFASCYLLITGIDFIGISYIIVYIGAIAVLFLFVIMMINIKLTDILETGTQYTKTLPLALAIVTLFIYILSNTLPFFNNNIPVAATNFYNLETLSNFNGQITFVLSSLSKHIEGAIALMYQGFNFTHDGLIAVDTLMVKISQIESVGFSLYTFGFSWLIITSIILLLAMFAAIILTKSFPYPKALTSVKSKAQK